MQQMARLARSLRQGEYHLLSHVNRWTKNGVWNRVLEKLKAKTQTDAPPEKRMLDSASIKVHPAGTSALKKARRPSESPAKAGLLKFPCLPQRSARGEVLLCLRETGMMRLRGENSFAR